MQKIPAIPAIAVIFLGLCSPSAKAQSIVKPWNANPITPSAVDGTIYCDQYVSLVACYAAVPSGGNTKIILPPNTTIVLTSTLNITKPNVIIECPSWGTVIQRGANSTAMPAQIVRLAGTGDQIRDCTIDGNGNVFSGASQELGLDAQNSLAWHNQVINLGARNGIALTAAGDTASYNTVTGLSSATIGEYGIWAINHVTVTIDHNIVSGTQLDGIGFDGTGSKATDNHVFNCQCNTSQSGGQIVGYPNYYAMLIANNTIDQGCGVPSNGIETNGFSVTVSGNTINNQNGAGISINPNSIGELLSGNTVLNSGQVGGATGVIIQHDVTNVTIIGNRFTDNQSPHTQTYGVGTSIGNQDHLVITGNDLTNNLTGPLQDQATGLNKNFAHNDGIDNVIPSVASASALALPVNPTVVLTGTTGVTSITGEIWTNRQVTLLPAGIVAFSAGNNIANSFTSSAGVQFSGVFDGALWHFH